MAGVSLEDVTKTYGSDCGEVAVVRGLSLEVADREFVVVVGPSGCGKTTTLRMIAGLEEVTSGTIRIGRRVVNGVAPKDRDIAMVFQNYALYPHMTAYKNMSFGLRMRKVPKTEIDEKVRRVAGMLGIGHLLERRPRELSGGERQRVAVGRAIVRNPQAFLFDEPLSNLDARLRVQMRAELKRLHHELDSTVIYVTHDQEEAMTLGDRIAVMRDGVVHQCGAPQTVYDAPRDRFVASFVGTPPMNFFEGRLVSAGGATCFQTGGGLIRLPDKLGRRLAGRGGGQAVLGVRPEDLSLGAPKGGGAEERCPACGTGLYGEFCHCCGQRRELRAPGAARAAGAAGPGGDSLPMRVSVVELLGDEKDVHLQAAEGVPVIARVPAEAEAVEGREVEVFLDVSAVQVFEPGEAGLNLGLNGYGAATRAN